MKMISGSLLLCALCAVSTAAAVGQADRASQLGKVLQQLDIVGRNLNQLQLVLNEMDAQFEQLQAAQLDGRADTGGECLMKSISLETDRMVLRCPCSSNSHP